MSSLGQLKVEQEVVKALAGSLAQSDQLIGVDSRLVEELYIDSIALVEVVWELNEMFGIELPGDEVAEWKTVREMCASVSNCMR